MVRSRSPHGSASGHVSDAGQSVDEPAVTFASMESLLHRMLSPLTASVEALRESNVQMLTSQNALTTRVDSMDLTIQCHSERLEVVEGQLGAQAAAAGRKVSPPRVPSPKPAQPSYADAASSGGSHNASASGPPTDSQGFSWAVVVCPGTVCTIVED